MFIDGNTTFKIDSARRIRMHLAGWGKRKTKTRSTNPHELNTKFVRYFVKFSGSCCRRCFQNFQKQGECCKHSLFQQPANL